MEKEKKKTLILQTEKHMQVTANVNEYLVGLFLKNIEVTYIYTHRHPVRLDQKQ